MLSDGLRWTAKKARRGGGVRGGRDIVGPSDGNRRRAQEEAGGMSDVSEEDGKTRRNETDRDRVRACLCMLRARARGLKSEQHLRREPAGWQKRERASFSVFLPFSGRVSELRCRNKRGING